MRLLLIPLVAALTLMVPSVSYSADFVLAGNGYGATSNGVQTTSLQALLDFSDSEIIFQSGRLLIGDDTHTITDMTLSLSNNKKSLKLTGTSDDLGITASGKLILSANTNSIYHIQGKTSDSKSFSIFAILKQDKKPIVSEAQKPTQKDILLLVKQTERIEWKSPYEFTVRTFDPKLNPLSDFYSTSGHLEGITISASITNPIGDKIKISDGVTQKFGYYGDSVIILDNARTGIYTLNVTASGKDYKTISKEFTFVVFPLNTRPS